MEDIRPSSTSKKSPSNWFIRVFWSVVTNIVSKLLKNFSLCITFDNISILLDLLNYLSGQSIGDTNTLNAVPDT